MVSSIPCNGKIGPAVIDKGWPTGLRIRTQIFKAFDYYTILIYKLNLWN